MRILIDADGCPVTDIAENEARRHNIPCIIVCYGSHVFRNDYSRIIITDIGADSTDFVLANMTTSGDIVVTQDYGLAAMCLAKGARVINQNGVIYSNKNMDAMLFARHIGNKARRAGFRTKGSKKRTVEQDEKFRVSFTSLL